VDTQIFQPPGDPDGWPAFRDALDEWREQTRARLRYDDALYRRPEFAWSASNYSCGFLMLCDETFYDWRSGRYTVDTFLEVHRREFGGLDSVVLWHAYPRIGVDERNQFDYYRDQPGGLDGLREAVGQFRRQGVRVHRLQPVGHEHTARSGAGPGCGRGDGACARRRRHLSRHDAAGRL
jgi:hypothetical protein